MEHCGRWGRRCPRCTSPRAPPRGLRPAPAPPARRRRVASPLACPCRHARTLREPRARRRGPPRARHRTSSRAHSLGRVVETPSHALLQEILPEGLAKPDDIPAEIFDYALGLFLEGRRLDMRAMARDLRIGRATLYRRVEGKAHLLDGVIWWLTRHLIVHALS